MTETSMFWAGTTIGDHGPYSEDEFSEFMRTMFCTDPATEGYLHVHHPGFNQDLRPTVNELVVMLLTGAALVYGTLYTNSSVEIFSTPADPAHSHYYRLVLRKSWASNTVRAVLLGPDHGSYPALTQTPGTTWEISMARILVAAGGTEGTLTDDRVMCKFPSV